MSQTIDYAEIQKRAAELYDRWKDYSGSERSGYQEFQKEIRRQAFSNVKIVEKSLMSEQEQFFTDLNFLYRNGFMLSILLKQAVKVFPV